MTKNRKLMPAVHPGEILLEDFMKPLRLSSAPAHQADTALRLARYFRTNPEFWLNLQSFYELELTGRSGSLSEIERHLHPAAELVS